MSHYPYMPAYPFFKENLSYQEQLMSQIADCRKARNLGDIKEIKNSHETLLDMVTPMIADDLFYTKIAMIEDEFKEEYERKYENYQERVAKAVAPSVVPKPSLIPNIAYWRRVYMACLALFERKKLLLKITSDERY